MSPFQQEQEKKKPEAVEQEPKPVTQAPEKATSASSRQQTFKVGVLGDNLQDVQRTVPQDEPPPLPANSELHAIGKRTPRNDGRFKVTGTARYPSDLRLPGMLYARMVNATQPHARVVSIDTSAAEGYSGVKAVHIIQRLLDVAELKDKSKEAGKYPVVRFAGQPVAAVAATSPAAAEAAARLVKVQYEPLPFVLDVDSARKNDSPVVFPGPASQAETAGGGGSEEDMPQKGNVRGPDIGGGRKGPKGNVDKGFSESDVVLEATFTTQVQTHSALETHGLVADWREDGLTVYQSTQSTNSVRDELAAVFNLPKSKVRVITEYMGGGFGAKFGTGTFGVAAAELSRKTKLPVRLFMDRKEEHWSQGNRPSSQQTLKIGAKRDGTLHAMRLASYGTAGVGTGAGTAGPVQNMYDCPNCLTEEYDVFTNAGPGAAFRAPGHPQGCFALEQMIDELAEKLSMDPLALRDKNDVHEARKVERRIGAEKFGWSRRHAPGTDAGPVKRGMGAAQAVWYRINNMDSACEVRIARDGSVQALSAVQDIGGGIRTVIAQVVAEELGLRPADIDVRIGDTNYPPGSPSGGSMTTGSMTPAVRNAAYRAREQFMEEVASALRVAPGDLMFDNGQVRTRAGSSMSFRQAAAKMRVEQVTATAKRSPEYGERQQIFLGGVQFCEIAVDTETGIIRVERFLAVHDCGRPMNPLTLESQVNGGILQGISYALYEDRRLDRNTGIMVNPNLEEYKILGAKDVPKIDIFFVEHYLGRSSTDAGGIGEPATIPTIAAIANAFYNATKARIRHMPMTPRRVLETLAAAPGTRSATGGLF
jgi:xanthine dehydrogenase YagR molybdenum-binding subunit